MAGLSENPSDIESKNDNDQTVPTSHDLRKAVEVLFIEQGPTALDRLTPRLVRNHLEQLFGQSLHTCKPLINSIIDQCSKDFLKQQLVHGSNSSKNSSNSISAKEVRQDNQKDSRLGGERNEVALKKSKLDCNYERNNGANGANDHDQTTIIKSQKKTIQPNFSNSNSNSNSNSKVTKGNLREGPPIFQLSSGSGPRQVTVRKWGGKVLVDIRQYYSDNEEIKPGKKGISLTKDQWNNLKSLVNDIDTAIGQLNT